MKVRASLSQCTQYKPAYFNLLAPGHSADLGEEAELGMTEENEDKVAWVLEIMYLAEELWCV
jgi:hypothetical protein